jgi:hypothetical protein
LTPLVEKLFFGPEATDSRENVTDVSILSEQFVHLLRDSVQEYCSIECDLSNKDNGSNNEFPVLASAVCFHRTYVSLIPDTYMLFSFSLLGAVRK